MAESKTDGEMEVGMEKWRWDGGWNGEIEVGMEKFRLGWRNGDMHDMHTVPQKGQKRPALNSTNDCA